jgi:hypothetical protein
VLVVPSLLPVGPARRRYFAESLEEVDLAVLSDCADGDCADGDCADGDRAEGRSPDHPNGRVSASPHG